MTEALLIIFAAGLIYYVAVKIAPRGLLFKLKKEEGPKTNGRAKVEKGTEKEAPSFCEEGQKHFNTGELSKAEKSFLSAIRTNPKDAKAYHFLGMIYLRQNEYRGAAEALKVATKLDQLNDTAYNNLGLALHNLRKNTEAIEAFERSIQLNDKIAHRYINLGLSLEATGSYEKAALAFENSSRIHENSENLTLLAKCYIKLKDKKLLRKTLERLLKVDPTNSWAKRTLASCED